MLRELHPGQHTHDVGRRDKSVGQETLVFEKGRLDAGYKSLKGRGRFGRVRE